MDNEDDLLSQFLAEMGDEDKRQKDAYNFYHSQMRITIEGAFGWLTQVWGMLRKQMPKEYTLKKIMAVVSCLCRLHNFLIDDKDDSEPVLFTEEDEWSLAVNGAAPMVVRNGIHLPGQLVDAGHHQDDDPHRSRRERGGDPPALPRAQLLAKVVERNLRRPTNRRR